MPEEIIPEEESLPIDEAKDVSTKFKLGPPPLSVQDVQRDETKKSLTISKKAIVDDVKTVAKQNSDGIKTSKQKAFAKKEEITPGQRLKQIDSIKLSPIVDTTKSTSEYDGLKKELDTLNKELTESNKKIADSGYPTAPKEPVAKEEEIAKKQEP